LVSNSPSLDPLIAPVRKSLRIGISSVSSHNYFIDREPFCCTTAEKDMGVLVDQSLKFHQLAAAIAAKANHILGLY